MKRAKLFILVILAGVNLSSSCPNDEPQSTFQFSREIDKVKELRAFFADALDPKPQANQETKIAMKEALLAHPGAAWLILNDPEIFQAAQIKLPKDFLIELESKRWWLSGRSESDIRERLRDQPDSFFVEIQDHLDREIENFDFEDVPAIKELEKIKVPELGPSWTRFFTGILTDYFPSLQLPDRKRVLASYFRNSSPTSNRTEIALSIIYGAGPFFHKYLQLVSDNLQTEGDPDLIELKEGLSKVKSGLPSIDPYDIKRYIESLESDQVYHLEIIRSLGAASVGETFLANFNVIGKPSKPIVIKFMRPGIEAIAQREGEFFHNLAQKISASMVSSVDEMKRQILEEMDYTDELRKLKRGYKVYNDADSPIRVAAPLEEFPQNKYWMAMEFAPGKTLRDIRAEKHANDDDSQIKYRAALFARGILLDLFAAKFFKVAFFSKPSGFFHGDLHEGNIMLQISDEVLTKLKERGIRRPSDVQKETVEALIKEKDKQGGPLFQLTLVDFGNAHFLKRDQREALLNVLVSGTQLSQSASAFLHAYNALSEAKFEFEEDTEAFKALLKELELKAFRKPGTGYRLVQHRLGDAIQILMEHDIPVPGVIQAFARTIVMFDDSFQELRSDGGKAGIDLEAFSLEKASQLAMACPLGRKHTYAPVQWLCDLPDIGLSKDNLNAMTGGWIGTWK